MARAELCSFICFETVLWAVGHRISGHRRVQLPRQQPAGVAKLPAIPACFVIAIALAGGAGVTSAAKGGLRACGSGCCWGLEQQ